MGFGGVFQFTQYYDDYGDSVNKIPMLEKFAAQSLVEYDGELIFSKEKFAQLIVQECANHCDLLLDHKISSEWSRGTHDCSRAIKKHFGIEE